jgi:hypothetical protein
MNTRTLRQISSRYTFAAVYLICLLAFTASFSFAQPTDIHQLSYNNSFWSDQDLNSNGSPGSLAAFPTTPNEQSHVYYVDNYSLHIHQQFYNGVSWDDEDLTALTGGPLAYLNPLAGFSVGNYQYVYYSEVNGDIHQLLYNNVGWKDTNITAKSTTQAQASFMSNIIAFTTTPALHVYYVDNNNNVRQLFSPDGTQWQDENLTNFDDPSVAPRLTAGFNIGNLQYVYWRDANAGDTFQLSYNNSTWSDTDLNQLIKTPFSGIYAALVIPGTQNIRLYSFNANNGHVVQLASPNNGKWSVTDLTQKSKGPIGQSGNYQLTAFATTPNNGLHVFYTYNHQVYQIYQTTPTTWAAQNLTQQTNGALSDGYLTGYSVQNLQYVFYETQ